MTGHEQWLLRTDTTTYAVTLGGDGRWAELAAWGPHGAEQGPSPMDRSQRTHFITPADAAPAEYIPYGLRPFTGADLIAGQSGGDRGSWWQFTGATADGDRALRLGFADEVLGLHTTLCYETVPGTDVILRWTELTCTGDRELRLERFDSAAVNVPAQGGARLTYLAGQWSQEFQLKQLELERGRFEMESTQGSAGHAYAPGSRSRTRLPRPRAPPPPTASPLSGPGTGGSAPTSNPAVRYGCAPAGCRTRAPSASLLAPPSPRPGWPAPSARTASTGWPVCGTATSVG